MSTVELSAEYSYNGFGERIKKVVYSGDQKRVTYYLYDGRTLVAEADQNGEIVAQYIYHEDQPVAKLQQRSIFAIHTDHLGTPRSATDEDQSLVWEASYTPFGEADVELEQITLNLRFPGQYHDQESNTHYNYFRDYDPTTGRYLTSDPVGLTGGLNSYAYVGGNPLGAIDPLGLFEPPPPGTLLYRALVQAGIIASADTPTVIGPADIAAAAYLVGAVLGITYLTVSNYLDKPDTADIDLIYDEILRYKPEYQGSRARTWENHEQLVFDLYAAQIEYLRTNSRQCAIGFDPELFAAAEQAIEFREQLNASLGLITGFLSPDGVYFPNETIYRAELFAYELYLENGGDLSFQDWYYRVRVDQDHAIPAVPPINGGFAQWFDALTPDQLDILWEDLSVRNKIKSRLRHPGGLHEWCMVCRAPTFKRWGVTAGDIARFRTQVEDLVWIHPDDGQPGGHSDSAPGGKHGSTKFHNELKKIIDESQSLNEFNSRLTQLIERWQIDPALLPPFITP